MQQFRRFGWLALVVVLVLLAAACDDGPGNSASEESDGEPVEVETTGESGPPKQPIEVVTAAATSAGSSAFELTGTSTVAGTSVDISAEGAFDYTSGNGEMTITTEVPGFGEMALEERIIDGVVFMNVGDVPGLGGGWTSLDISEAFGAEGLGNSIGAQPSPTEQLDQLRAAGDVEEVGTEEVRGEEATHYTVVLDFQALLDEGADALGEVLGDEDVEFFTGLFESLGGDTTVDVWITDDGLPVRHSTTSSFEIAGQVVESDITMEFFDFGVDVNPEPPPADEVMSFDDLFGGLGGLGGLGGDIVEVPEGVPGGGSGA